MAQALRRADEPFEGHWALSGGFVDVGESVEDAAMREVHEETGLEVKMLSLVGVYSKPDRDLRGHTVSIAYLARTVSGSLKTVSDAAEAGLVNAREVSLAFDHRKIIDDALSILRSRI